tara:strand:+ start:2697 stop:3053 length:357 start_codon:yes stop_codon:yes gene_type:complete
MEKTEEGYLSFEVNCPSRAWSDGKEDVEKVLEGIVAVINKHIEENNLSGSAITFVLHKMVIVYVRAMMEVFKDDDQKSSVYVMTAQMTAAIGNLYEEIREGMPASLLRLLEEPTRGDA